MDGSDLAPTDSTKLLQWKVKDARVMSWILGSVDPLIVINLKPSKTTKTMWEYLKKVYYQDNNARRFQLENDISNYSQCNLSIQDYYSGFQNLWAEYTDIIYAKIPYESLSVVQQVHEQTKRDQFLMKLQSKFEITCSNLMNRDPLPSLDVCFGGITARRTTSLYTRQFQAGQFNCSCFCGSGKRKGSEYEQYTML